MKEKLRIAIALLVMLIAGLLACSSAVAPCEITGAEVCNGRDDDCNGCSDGTPQGADCIPLEQACANDCGDGVEQCVRGEWVNCDAPQPEDETCNYTDDDCNGTIDDGLANCHCTGGIPPIDETCNRIDDDCDEMIDNTPACGCRGGNPPSQEVCNAIDDDCNEAIDDGLTACACTGGNPPGTESCNQIDDDCDECIDERSEDPCQPLQQTCSTNCGDGTETCTNGTWQNCDAPTPSSEVCNNFDDDCNGTIDDGLANCQCTGGTAPSQEVCDGVDNDCNQQVDEDNGSGGQCRGFGEPCNGFADCVTQICVGDDFARYCSQTCDPLDPSSCPNGYRCFTGPNQDYCLRNYPSCDRDEDCSQGEVCTVHDADDQMSKVTECRPALDPGGVPGDDCSSSRCSNDLCNHSMDVCSEVCNDVTHCTDQYLGLDTSCVLRGWWMIPGECGRDAQCPALYTCQDAYCRGPACTDDAQCEASYMCETTDLVCAPRPFVYYVGQCMIECVADRDCPTDWVCGPAVLVDRSLIQGYCRQPSTGNTIPTGSGPCGNPGDPACDHGICYWPPVGDTYCTQLCGNANDCPASMNCTPGNLNMGQELGQFPNTDTCTF